jgi:DNA-binding MarR family transcriptional regulator
MKERSPNSHLQNKILLSLAQQPIKTVTELAHLLGASRPSVSRAINTLANADFVSKKTGWWKLTDSGIEEADKLRHDLPKRVEKLSQSVSRMIENHDLISRFSNVGTSVQNMGTQSDLLGSSNLGIINNASGMFSDAARSSALADIAASFGKITNASGMFGDVARSSALADIAASFSKITNASGMFSDAARSSALADIAASFGKITNASGMFSDAARSSALADTAASFGKIINASGMFSDAARSSALADIANFGKITGVSGMFSDPVRSLLDITGSGKVAMFGDVGKPLWIEATGNALSAFADSQRINLFMLEEVSRSRLVDQWATGPLSKANIDISAIIHNLGTISGYGFAHQDYMSKVTGLIAQTARIGDLYSYHIKSIADHMVDGLLPLQTGLEIVVPTQVTSAYVDSVKNLILDAEDKDSNTNIVIFDRDSLKDSDIYYILSTLGPKFTKMWNGAWETLYSSSSDSIRQAAHSGRELFNQILHELAPDVDFTKADFEKNSEKNRPTRKMRIHKIIRSKSKSAATLVEAIAVGGDEIYSRLSAVAHDHTVDSRVTQREVAGYLKMIEGLILCIFSFKEIP